MKAKHYTNTTRELTASHSDFITDEVMFDGREGGTEW